MKSQEEFLKKHKKHHHFVRFMRLLLLLSFLILWEVSADLGWIDPFFFSSPIRMILCIRTLFLTENLMMHIMVTLSETLFSFFLVLLVSLGSATLLWFSHSAAEILEPYLVVLNSLPKSALAPLFIVWLGTGMKTIIIAGISVAIFTAIINLYVGFTRTEPEKIKLITTLGGTKKDAFFKVVFPSNIPLLLATLKVNIGLALVGVIIGEFLAARQGLGYLIIYGSQVFKMSMVISSILILCVIAMLLYLFLQFLEHRYKKRIS